MIFWYMEASTAHPLRKHYLLLGKRTKPPIFYEWRRVYDADTDLQVHRKSVNQKYKLSRTMQLKLMSIKPLEDTDIHKNAFQILTSGNVSIAR